MYQTDEALSRMTPRESETPRLKIRHVFLAVFAVGLFAGLMIADPIARLTLWVIEAESVR